MRARPCPRAPCSTSRGPATGPSSLPRAGTGLCALARCSTGSCPGATTRCCSRSLPRSPWWTCSATARRPSSSGTASSSLPWRTAASWRPRPRSAPSTRCPTGTRPTCSTSRSPSPCSSSRPGTSPSWTTSRACRSTRTRGVPSPRSSSPGFGPSLPRRRRWRSATTPRRPWTGRSPRWCASSTACPGGRRARTTPTRWTWTRCSSARRATRTSASSA
mmetsp:Transcript_15698/g.52947  ORF Transcript_15698/g.52947 Transcript_15698/m.52947 type:complete len:218 (-) Transcript_15698:544-1197(-)